MADCQSCRHWRRNPQSAVPTGCLPRERRFLWLRWTEKPSVWDDLLRLRIEFDNQRGDCRRYPKAVETNEDYACAEFDREVIDHMAEQEVDA